MESRGLTAWRAMWNYFSGRSDKYRTELDKRESNKAVGTILKIGINEIGGGSLANAGNRLFSSIEILIWKMKV